MTDSTQKSQDFKTRLIFGIIAIVLGVTMGLFTGIESGFWWGLGMIALGVAWIVYAYRHRN